MSLHVYLLRPTLHIFRMRETLSWLFTTMWFNLVIYINLMTTYKKHLSSVLWRCWFGGRKGIRPVKKTEWWGAGVVICLERGADLHTAQLMLMPLIVSCFSKMQIGFTFLVPGHPGSPGQRAIKQVCVCSWFSQIHRVTRTNFLHGKMSCLTAINKPTYSMTTVDRIIKTVHSE